MLTCGSIAAKLAVMAMLLSVGLHTTHASYDIPDVDPDILGDIFQGGGISADLCKNPDNKKICSGNGLCKFGKCECGDGYSGTYCETCLGCEGFCEKLRPCVEGQVFTKYWLHFESAFECSLKCKEYKFIQGDLGGYDQICEYTLPGDSLCPSYSFRVDGTNVHVYRPPCLADDLDVNVGLWKGEQAEKDGNTYPNGWGTLQYNKEDHLNRDKYLGEMVWGVRDGHGTLYWKDGSYYSGNWKENVKEGEGTIFYANGDVYTGQWTKEKKEGRGRYIYSQGMTGSYEGEFVGGKKCGKGTLEIQRPSPDADWEYFDGTYSQQGGWLQGLYNSSKGFFYSGNFDDQKGRYSGEGTYSWSCGKTYVGSFLDGLPHGHGVMTYNQGYIYNGNFKAGKFDGKGHFIWSPNNSYKGTFKNGEMTGVGVYALENGALFDSSVGLYYPNRDNKNEFFEAHFDGKVLRIKKQKPRTFEGGY